jgi:hypothetical protein
LLIGGLNMNPDVAKYGISLDDSVSQKNKIQHTSNFNTQTLNIVKPV